MIVFVIRDREFDFTDDEEENKEFGDLCEMAGRFSDDIEELKIPNMYFSKNDIIEKAKEIKKRMN